jgi:hypothetical protein
MLAAVGVSLLDMIMPRKAPRPTQQQLEARIAQFGHELSVARRQVSDLKDQDHISQADWARILGLIEHIGVLQREYTHMLFELEGIQQEQKKVRAQAAKKRL